MADPAIHWNNVTLTNNILSPPEFILQVVFVGGATYDCPQNVSTPLPIDGQVDHFAKVVINGPPITLPIGAMVSEAQDARLEATWVGSALYVTLA